MRRRADLARRAALALLVGFPVAMGITALATLAGEAVGWLSLDTVRNVTEVDFIFQVGPISFVVALLAGAAGMLSLMSSKSAALVGVFISVTTVPAAGFAVVAAILGDWDVAAQSAAQLARQPGRHRAGGRAGAGAPPARLADPAVGPDLSSHARVRALRWRAACGGINAYGYQGGAGASHQLHVRPAGGGVSRTSSGCVRRRTRVPRSRPTRCRSNRPTTSSTGSRTRSETSSPGWCFPTRARSLTITVGLIADLKVINPFDFFIEEYAETFPFEYTKDLLEDLKPYLRPVDEDGRGLRTRRARPGLGEELRHRPRHAHHRLPRRRQPRRSTPTSATACAWNRACRRRTSPCAPASAPAATRRGCWCRCCARWAWPPGSCPGTWCS